MTGTWARGNRDRGARGSGKESVAKELDTGEQLTGTGVQHGKVKKMLGGDGDGVMKWLRGSTRRKIIIMDWGGVGINRGTVIKRKKEDNSDWGTLGKQEAWQGRGTSNKKREGTGTAEARRRSEQPKGAAEAVNGI